MSKIVTNGLIINYKLFYICNSTCLLGLRKFAIFIIFVAAKSKLLIYFISQ